MVRIPTCRPFRRQGPAVGDRRRHLRRLALATATLILAGAIDALAQPPSEIASDRPQAEPVPKAEHRKRTPFTRADVEAAVVPGFPNARFWADSATALAPLIPQKGRWLMLSGGGADGAFGAGLLNGLSETGRRPDYAVVTGVSTGALIATLAFAGPRYDNDLRDNFTETSAIDVFEIGSTGESLLDTWPLKKLIAKRVTPKLLADVAEQHRRGRRLFIQTSNLDAERAVIWNMGEIASHGGERALKLFRDVLLASASVPGLFPPVLLEVEANGRRFEEMHADGGMGSPLYFGPDAALLPRPGENGLAATSMTIIVNGKLAPEFQVAERNTISILGRSVTMGVKMATHAMIARLRDAAQRQGVGFEVASIDDSFDVPARGAFDQQYMRTLFDYGLQQGKSGEPFSNGWPGPKKPTIGLRPD